MKALFIGGTGTISMAVTRRVLELGWDLVLLNRGKRNGELAQCGYKGTLTEISCDIDTENEADTAEKLRACLKPGEKFDTAADFIVFTPEQAARDYRLFKEITKQYIFVSSVTVYQKPLKQYLVTEGASLGCTLWEYARNKVKTELFLTEKCREEGFPLTIVRPAHTYDERAVPLGAHGNKGSWQVLKRMLEGKPVIIHGDGTSLWAMTMNRDFAKGFTGLMGNAHAIGEAVHITTDEAVTWNQVYEAAAAALGVELKAVHIASDFLAEAGKSWGYDFRGGLLGDKANSQVFDNTKLKRLVPDFTATVRFDQGVREAAAYILAHKECQVEDPDFDLFCDKVIAAWDAALSAVTAPR